MQRAKRHVLRHQHHRIGGHNACLVGTCLQRADDAVSRPYFHKLVTKPQIEIAERVKTLERRQVAPGAVHIGRHADVIGHIGDGDPYGNLVFRKSARNFNPIVASCGRVTVAEVEELVPAGTLDPDHIHTPGIFVQRLILATHNEKRIEQRTLRPEFT